LDDIESKLFNSYDINHADHILIACVVITSWTRTQFMIRNRGLSAVF